MRLSSFARSNHRSTTEFPWSPARHHRQRSRRARRSAPRGEALESRWAMAADPIITEFSASNAGVLKDKDGDYPDWIEIYNRGDQPATMTNWHLTDSDRQLTKWTFPNVSIPPQGFLVVFASGKDRRDPAAALHTNFQLASQGDYLALVRPDGTSVVSEFGTEYPEQFTDISYGLPMTETESKWIQSGSAAQILAPTNDALGTSWTNADFVPGPEWQTQLPNGSPIRVGLGYETAPGSGFLADIQTNVDSLVRDVNASLYVRIPFTVDDLTKVNDLLLRVKYDDGVRAYLNGSLIDLANAPEISLYNSTALTSRANDLATQYEEFDETDRKSLLRAGTNVLSFQVLNVVKNDGDLLLSPEFLTTTSRVDTARTGYFSAPTPGAVNGAEFSLGPRVEDVSHTPHDPQATDAITVTGRVSKTLLPLGNVELVYRVMYGAETTVAMNDQGTNGDATAGDGVYTGQIPAGVATPGQMVRYYLRAHDNATNETRSPRITDTLGLDRSPEYFGTVIVDPAILRNLPVFQWFTEKEVQADNRTGARVSVYYAGEFYDNVYARERGAATNGESQKFNFNEDHKFFVNDLVGRVREINLNAQGSDPSFLRQSLAFNTFNYAGSEASTSFLILMRANAKPDRVATFIEQVDEDFLQRNGLDPRGSLYKFVQRNNLDPVFSDITTGLEKKTRLDEGLADVKQIVDGLTQADRAARARSVFDQFDVAQLMNFLAVRSLEMDADDVRKNFYGYRDTEGTQQWSLFPWDKDWTFGIEGDGGPFLSHPFFGDFPHRKSTSSDQWNRLYDTVFNDPVLSQMYLRRLRSVMDQLLQPPDTPVDDRFFEKQVDARLAAAGATLSSSAINAAKGALKNYFASRRRVLYETHSIDRKAQTELKDLVSENTTNVRYFVPTDDTLGTSWTDVAEPANAQAWTAAQTPIGFGTAFNSVIKTTVNPLTNCPNADCTSIYLRMPFHVDDVTKLNGLSLRMKYDDGFVAYLNGQVVARAGARDPLGYNSTSGSRTNAASLEFANFDISEFTSVLHNGQNILAIHAINQSPTNNDMLVSPVLIDGKIGDVNAAGIPHAQVGNPSVKFGVMEHDPASGNQDEEYIEIKNDSAEAADISGWSIEGGIRHAFPPGSVIPARGSMFITPDVPSFMRRASSPHGGEGRFVQGNYEGHLSNLGESLRLLAADGTSMDLRTIAATPSSVQNYLRISEIHYHPGGTNEATEFIELTNISSGANAIDLNLAGIRLSGGPNVPWIAPAGTHLGPGEYLIVAKDPTAFRAHYTTDLQYEVVGPYLGGLDNGGETLRLDDAHGNTVLEIDYRDNPLWPQAADGAGSSLELIDPAGTSRERLSLAESWQASLKGGGSPGQQSSPRLGIVMNEVRSNGAASDSDAIELKNVGSQPVNLSGWYLSDSSDQFIKYAFPNNTVVNPGSYLVVNESQLRSATDPSRRFGLDGVTGDQVWLVQANPADGSLVRFGDMIAFDGAPLNETWGRSPDGSGLLQPMRNASLGAANGDVRVGPLFISEVNYHPAEPDSAARTTWPTLTSSDLEFIEIRNPTSSAVSLRNWRLRGGVDFDFPNDASIAAGKTILIVPFNPTGHGNGTLTRAFRQHYGLADDVGLLGGYQGQLDDSQDWIELQRPGLPAANDPTAIPRYLEDQVTYHDQTPWPAADGSGMSLVRRDAASSGAVPRSWLAAAPNPGTFSVVNGDFNNDRVVDGKDIDAVCVAIRQHDLRSDFDGNGVADSSDLLVFTQMAFGSNVGDANLDGIFNSRDLVQIFQAGEYDDGQVGNSTWAEGDWNCSGDFDSEDLVLAFQVGEYSFAATRAAESASLSLAISENLGSALAPSPTEPFVEPRDTEINRPSAPVVRQPVGTPKSLSDTGVVDAAFEELFDDAEAGTASSDDVANEGTSPAEEVA